MADKKMSAMAIDSSIDGTERLLEQGSDGLVVLVSAIGAYTIDVLAAAATATPTTGDYLLAYRGTDEKRMTLDAVASYAVASAWSVATTVTPTASGDLLLVSRSGTIYDMDVDTLKTYTLTGIQATVMNLSTLDTGTPANTDLVTICQTTTGKKATIASLETLLWTDYATYVAGLTAVATAADSNKFYVLEGSTPKYVTATVLATYMSAEIIALGTIQASVLDTLDTYTAALDAVTVPANADLLYCTQGGTAKKLALLDLANFTTGISSQIPWKQISTDKYTATPSSTSIVAMSDTGDFKLGSPVKYTYGGISYYGVVSALSSNASITVSGAPLVVASPLTALYVGSPDMVTQVNLHFPGAYAASVADILLSINGQYLDWMKSAAYLCQFAVTHGTADTGANQPKINCKVGGSLVFTGDSNNGLAVSVTPGSWNDASSIEVSITNYSVARGDAIEVRVTSTGTNANAEDLSIIMLFVSE